MRPRDPGLVPGSRLVAGSRLVPDNGGMPETLVLSWEDLDALVARLAGAVGREFDLVVAITRGGLVPAGMLAYRLGLREILVAGVEFYRDGGGMHERPLIGHFPDDRLLAGRRVLVVDEVWETGETMSEVLARLRAAGADPVSAVIHYKPGRSRVVGAPDHWAATVESWVTYPYKAGG
jgi:hypoxanthine phosphoribosyltransferase